MFLCDKCHKESGCERSLHVVRSRGRCEQCGELADCVYCTDYKTKAEAKRRNESMSDKPKYATLLRYETPDTWFINLVVHDCTCLDFMRDIQAEIDRLLKEGITGKLDLFWHLDTYCRCTYGECYWNNIPIDAFQHAVLGPEGQGDTEGITARSVAARMEKEAKDAKHRLSEIVRFVKDSPFLGTDETAIILGMAEGPYKEKPK